MVQFLGGDGVFESFVGWERYYDTEKKTNLKTETVVTV